MPVLPGPKSLSQSAHARRQHFRTGSGKQHQQFAIPVQEYRFALLKDSGKSASDFAEDAVRPEGGRLARTRDFQRTAGLPTGTPVRTRREGAMLNHDRARNRGSKQVHVGG